MKKLNLLLPVMTLSLILSACTLDSFLFNPREKGEYELFRNALPDSMYEEVSFSSGGETLYGYYLFSNGQHPDLTFLYCHGNKHNLDKYWERVQWLHQLGGNVFIFDYQGFGKSSGDGGTEASLYQDGEAALEYVLNRPETNPDSLCFYGFSLGNVVSIYLSADVYDPLCLIAESPFASANSLTQGAVHFGLPAGWVTDCNFDNAEKIKNIATPFLLFHGSEDDLIEYEANGKVVFQNAPEPKQQVISPGADHNSVPNKLGIDNYLQIIADWVNI